MSLSDFNGGSRHSQTNCADADSVAERDCSGDTAVSDCDGDVETGEDQKCESIDVEEDRNTSAAIYGILSECESEYADLARRALSVVPGHKLRKEVTREIRSSGGSYKSKTVIGALKAFLRWFAEQEDMKIVGQDMASGEEVVWPAESSFDESYLAEKYGTIKQAERTFKEDGEDLHTAMLTLTGSNENKHGKPRCPGDHVVDLKASYDITRRELQRVMDDLGLDRYDPENPSGKWWEYAVVAEPHKSGYIHLHVAVFTSHEIKQSDFSPVMEKHVEKCDMAGTDAHRNSPCEEHTGGKSNVWDSAEGSCDDCHNPVSVRDVESAVDNLGSYIAAYMGPSGSELWDLPVSQLIAYSAVWATNQRRIHFSQGFNKAAKKDREKREDEKERENEGRIIELQGIRTGDGEDYPVHDKKKCKRCERVFKELVGDECPNCGGEVKSDSLSYLREIRGIPRGDPPPIRD